MELPTSMVHATAESTATASHVVIELGSVVSDGKAIVR